MMTGLTQDFRYALRQLGKAPGFAAVAIVTLALGIGANTAIFSLLDQALLRSLPVKDSDRLVILQSTGSFNGHTSSRIDENFSFSYPMYRDLRDHNSVFSGLLATTWTQAGVQWHNQPELVATELVSGNYFDVLGVQPALGRVLVASDDVVPDANPVVVLSFNYWQRRFGSDPTVVNQSLLVNGQPFTILGVAAPGFHSVVMGDTPDLFAPMTMKAEIRPGITDLQDRTSRWLNIVGKLEPGLTREQAEAGINPLWYSIRADELKQRGHSSETFQGKLPDQLAPVRARRRQRIFSAAARCRRTAADHHGHGWSGRADGLRQRGQPSAGTSGWPHPRNVGPLRARRKARARGAAIVGRRPVAGTGRRCAGHRNRTQHFRVADQHDLERGPPEISRSPRIPTCEFCFSIFRWRCW